MYVFFSGKIATKFTAIMAISSQVSRVKKKGVCYVTLITLECIIPNSGLESFF